MICIFTALYPEAQPLIQALQLKKDTGASVFQRYLSEDHGTELVLTGPGPVRAAAAVGYVLGRENGITLVNYGSCAAESVTDSGTLYRGCKLVSADEGRTFYPDMLVQSRLPDAEIVTGGKVWKAGKMAGGKVWNDGKMTGGTLWNDGESAEEGLPVLHDMEAAAIYEAGNLRLGPHQMHFLKFVSDLGIEEGERITPQEMRETSYKAAGRAVEYIQNLRQFDVPDAGIPDTGCDKLAEDLHASVTMRAQLRQLFLYAHLSGIDTDALTGEFYDKKRLPARDKREGAKILRELRKRILAGGTI